MPDAGHQHPAGEHYGVATTRIRHFSDLIVWQRAFALGLRVFELSKRWPGEERFALTDQVKRSSRAIGANIAEAWGKRRYAAHFVSKLTDADAEAHETEHWLMYAKEHAYLRQEEFTQLTGDLREVGRMLGKMMSNPDGFLLKKPEKSADI